MDLSTNIIRNVYNIGTNSCDAGTKYCTEEYSLYFPCLKNITKGQNVCFDFYIADGNTQDVVDLRTVESISLNLNGQFNCSYGTFSYPENILSLQREKDSEIYTLDFDDKKLCTLCVIMVDRDSQDILNSIGDECTEPLTLWSGARIKLVAKDTPTHIFVGWGKIDPNEEDCPDETLEDSIISTSNIFYFTIHEDTNIIAIYRERKKFNVVSDPTNRFSHFRIDYNTDIPYYISNRDEELFNDDFDAIEDVLEGYEIVATCIPCFIGFDSESDTEDDESYEFVQWKDGNKDGCRVFKVGGSGCDGTKYFEDGNLIKLKATCSGPKPGYIEPPVTDKSPNNIFDENGIYAYVRKPFTEDEYLPIEEYSIDGDIYDLVSDGQYIISSDEVYKKYIDEDEYLYFNSGRLVLSSKGIEKGIKIDIEAKADDYCELQIRLVKDGEDNSENDYSTDPQVVSTDDFQAYTVYFTKCNGSNIEITTNGNCLIDKITVYKEVIIDGGKAQFCLDAETTSNIPSGPLSVNGAIAVGDDFKIDGDGNPVPLNPQAYGLTTTVIGNVNRIPKITII